ncbi:MAG: PRD domain-containing protein [Bacillus sp. (in: firmicutes)]
MYEINLDDRVIQIIELTRKKMYSSLEYIATTLGVSTRTIRNDIRQLNDDLKEIAAINNEKGKGFSLQVFNQQVFEDLLIQLKTNTNTTYDNSQKRLASIIDKLITSDEPIILDELAYSMNISRTTLVNELKKAALALQTYSLSIKGKQNNGMYLTGEELHLRFFILDHIFNYLYDEYPLDKDVSHALMEVMYEYDFESNTQTRLMQTIIVMLDRLLKNKSLKTMDNKYKKLQHSKDYQIAKKLVEVIQLRLPISIPDSEILFLAIPIAGRRTPTNNRTIADITITEDIKALIDAIMEQLGFDKEIMKQNISFFTDLQYHLTFMLNRLMFGTHLKNPLLGDVKEKYPLAFKMAEVAGQVIQKRYCVSVSEDELGYLAFYFCIFIDDHEGKNKRFQKVAVICGTGRGTSKLISMQLQKVLHHNTKIDVISEEECTTKLLESYDLVFTTILLPFEIESPLIRIHEIFNEQMVAQQVEKASYLKKFNLKDTESHYSILKRLIDKDKFFLLDSHKNYHENLEMMVNHLTLLGYVDEKFLERLVEREKKGTMLFDQAIALPHTINYQSNSIQLALGVFLENIIEGNKSVKLIFLLGLPKQTDYDASLLVKIYDEIIHLASRQEIVNKLTEARSYEEISRCLEQVNVMKKR